MPDTQYLKDVLVILLAAVACVPLFQYLRLGPVLGYLVAGAAIGPYGLGLIEGVRQTKALAELGVVFLLFTIGLELTVDKLKALSARVYGIGLSQIGLTAVAIAAVAYVAGVVGPAAVIIGGGLALSSTAIVVPILAEQRKLVTAVGQTTLAVLLLQDLAVGPLLVLVEVLSRDGGGAAASLFEALGLAAAKAVAAIAVIVAVGQLLLKPVFRMVAGARSPELFVGMALLVALGTSWVTEHAGLSMAFGAFLAGLLLAETEFRHQVAADIEPFRGLLLGLFFMTVGMSVDLPLVVSRFGAVLALVGVVMAGKALLIAAIARVFRESTGHALRLGGLLAQGGEFAFVLFGLAAAAGIVVDELAQLLTAAVAVSMALMPLGVIVARRLIGMLERRGAAGLDQLAGRPLDVADHVVIVGFGEKGRIVARLLQAYGTPYVVLDLNARRVKEGRADGEPIYYGDATNEEVLKGLRADEARAVVVATDTPGVAEGVAAIGRHAFPGLPLIARGGSERAVVELRRAGITAVVQESTETGLKLVGAVFDVGERATAGTEA
jgi:CPA2 family monovalent cation:H+ antiporter-2